MEQEWKSMISTSVYSLYFLKKGNISFYLHSFIYRPNWSVNKRETILLIKSEKSMFNNSSIENNLLNEKLWLSISRKLKNV